MEYINQHKVGIIASFGKSIAIWNCMRQHIDLMRDGGAIIKLYVSETENTNLIQEEYFPLMVTFSNKKDLRRKLLQEGTDVLWYPDVICTVKYGKLIPNIRVITWIQGSLPDESYIRHKNRMRKWLLEIYERIGFRKSDGLVFVSTAMREYYEAKYRKSFSECAIIPCLSDFSNYEPKTDRIPESYVYIGGTAAWQCFDEIVDIYGKIRTDKSLFHIITLNTEEAQAIVSSKLPEAKEISVYPITEREKIPEVLSSFQYGFLIRKESPVNYVSSPIKFLEYLSCGVNVIMTDAVPYYAKLIENNKVGTVLESSLKNIKVNEFSPRARQVYEDNFDRKQFVNAYRELLSSNNCDGE